MEHIDEMIQSIVIIMLFCLALSFHMIQLDGWKEEIRLVQKQIELEQDVGLSTTWYE